MTIQVQLYAQLRDLAGVSKLDLAVHQGATVSELMEKVYELKPVLRAQDKTTLVGSGVDFVQRNHVLGEGEEIALMPPVQGG